jgi:hypothetical protein
MARHHACPQQVGVQLGAEYGDATFRHTLIYATQIMNNFTQKYVDKLDGLDFVRLRRSKSDNSLCDRSIQLATSLTKTVI